MSLQASVCKPLAGVKQSIHIAQVLPRDDNFLYTVHSSDLGPSLIRSSSRD
jgi:hypothetical protein